MKYFTLLLLYFAILTGGCRRDPNAEIKYNLIKAMTNKLQTDRPADAPSPHFKIVDVAYYQLGPWYRCEFKVKLTRPDGTDTTGTIRSKIATDYSQVIK